MIVASKSLYFVFGSRIRLDPDPGYRKSSSNRSTCYNIYFKTFLISMRSMTRLSCFTSIKRRVHLVMLEPADEPLMIPGFHWILSTERPDQPARWTLTLDEVETHWSTRVSPLKLLFTLNFLDWFQPGLPALHFLWEFLACCYYYLLVCYLLSSTNTASFTRQIFFRFFPLVSLSTRVNT